MVSYLAAFSWGILILVSWIGWGSVLRRILFPGRKTDWAQRAAWGLASSVAVGGVLEVSSSISRTVLLLYVGAGVAAWIIDALSGRRQASETASHIVPRVRHSKVVIAAGALALLLALVLYAGCVSVTRHDLPSGYAGAVRFNQADDFQGYLLFPERMLQSGSMGRDPFNARRIEAALGGQSFLHALLLSVLSVQNLHILDPGLGLLLIMGLLWGNFRERSTPPEWSAGLLLLVVLLDPPTVNIASLYTGAALFISLYRTLAWKELAAASLVSRIVIVALIAAAICSLKSNLIPACGLVLACSYICYLISRDFQSGAIVETAITAVLTVGLAVPWMISLHRSSGTFLYPLLGRGYHMPFHWLTFPVALSLALKHLADPSVVALLLIGIWYLASRRRAVHGREAGLSLLIGALIGHIVITVATGEPNNSRYSYPFVLAATLMLLTEAVSGEETTLREKFPSRPQLVAGAAVLFLIGANWSGTRVFYVEALRSAAAGVRHASIVSDRQSQASRALQESVPPKAAMLARLERPFLLDFRRNPLFVIDYAVSSPPPGMPLKQGGEALARYLASLSIRYVAYSYRTHGERAAVIGHDIYSPFTLFQIQSTLDLEDELEELGKTRRRIYDDGDSFVLDLAQPAGTTRVLTR